MRVRSSFLESLPWSGDGVSMTSPTLLCSLSPTRRSRGTGAERFLNSLPDRDRALLQGCIITCSTVLRDCNT